MVDKVIMKFFRLPRIDVGICAVIVFATTFFVVLPACCCLRIHWDRLEREGAIAVITIPDSTKDLHASGWKEVYVKKCEIDNLGIAHFTTCTNVEEQSSDYVIRWIRDEK